MVFVVKVPGINGLGKTEGCRNSGNAILKALYEIHSNEQGKPLEVKNLDLEEIHLDNSNLEYSNELIYKNSFETFEEKEKVVFLGGDHSISYSLVKGFLDHCNNSDETKEAKEPCLIVFDAHADCMKYFKEPTNEGWLRALIEEGFPVEGILLVGVRNMWKEEVEFLHSKKIKTISINSFVDDFESVCDSIMEFASGKELYVSFDIDFIDPAFAPSTNHLEPGGLSARETIFLIQRISKMKNLKGFDLVEINSEKDMEKNNVTVKLGAKILSELI